MQAATTKYEVPWERVCWHCNAADFHFECTDELTAPQGLIGQDRALKAIQFGLEVDKRGYNLFVSGLTGTGKASAIKRHLQAIIDERKAEGVQSPIYDWCYVHNFSDPDKPQGLRLPSGKGKLLSRTLDELLKNLQEEMPKLFTGEEFESQRKQIEEEGRTSYQKMLQGLEQEVRAENFGLQLSQAEINLYPLSGEGGPISPEEYTKLDEEERRAIDDKRAGLFQQVQDTLERLKAIEKETVDKVKGLGREIGGRKLSELFINPVAEWGDEPQVITYLVSERVCPQQPEPVQWRYRSALRRRPDSWSPAVPRYF